MRHDIDRRHFLRLAGGVAAAGLSGLLESSESRGSPANRDPNKHTPEGYLHWEPEGIVRNIVLYLGDYLSIPASEDPKGRTSDQNRRFIEEYRGIVTPSLRGKLVDVEIADSRIDVYSLDNRTQKTICMGGFPSYDKLESHVLTAKFFARLFYRLEHLAQTEGRVSEAQEFWRTLEQVDSVLADPRVATARFNSLVEHLDLPRYKLPQVDPLVVEYMEKRRTNLKPNLVATYA